MKVGVVVQHGPGQTMEAKFEAIRREGFTSCQLVSWIRRCGPKKRPKR